MNYKKLLTRISFITLLSVSVYFIAYSCGWSEDECDSYTSFVNPNIVEVKNASDYYYTPSSMFYTCDVDSSNLNDKSKYDNFEEWKNYTNASIATKDIEWFINTNSLDTLSDFYYFIEKNKAAKFSKTFNENEMTKWFLTQKDLEALGYILFAKKCEKLSAMSSDAWDMTAVDTAMTSKLIKSGKQLYAAAKKDFIKERYAFQLIKTAFYAKKYNQIPTLLKDYYEPVKGDMSSIDVRIGGYKAGALFRSKHQVESAYEFSKLFDESDDYTMANSNTLGFVWSYNESKINNVLALCKNNHEKAMVQALASMRNTETYSVKSIANVYDLEPGNKYLDVILIREINKIEHEYVESKYQVQRGYYIYDNWMGNSSMRISEDEMKEWFLTQNKAQKSLTQLSQYLENKAIDGKIKTPSLWYATAGYLYMLQGKYEECERLLTLASSQHPSSKIAAQIKMLTLINSIQRVPKMDANIEANILKDLNWFEQYASQNHAYQHNFRNVLKTVLPLKYMQSKDSIKMAMVYHRYENSTVYWDQTEDEKKQADHFSDLYYQNSGDLMDKYFTQVQLDNLINYNQHPTTAFDKWLLQGNQYSTQVLNELKSVKYFRTFDYEMAQKTIAKNHAIPIVPNLFVAHIRDYQDGYEADSQFSYSTRQVLDTLIQLKKKNLVDLQSAFDYACALYSLSYHGKCHSAWTFNRDYTAIDPFYKNILSVYTPFQQQYYYVEDAKLNFERVYRESSNELLKQQSLWMLAKCEQKTCSIKKPDYLGWWDMDNKEAIDYVNWNVNNNKYLQAFHKNYKQTPFYEEVFQECSYLRIFASKK